MSLTCFFSYACYGDYKRSRDKLILFHHRKVLFCAGIVDIFCMLCCLTVINFEQFMELSFSRTLGILGMKA